MIFIKEVDTAAPVFSFSEGDLYTLFGFPQDAEGLAQFNWFVDSILPDSDSTAQLKATLLETLELSINYQLNMLQSNQTVRLPRGVSWSAISSGSSEVKQVLSTSQLAVLCGLPVPSTNQENTQLAEKCLQLRQKPATLTAIVDNVITGLQNLRAY